MAFTVHVRKKAWTPAVRWACALLCVLIPGAFAWILSGGFPGEVLGDNGIFLLIAGIFAVSLILPAALAFLAVSFYRAYHKSIFPLLKSIQFFFQLGRQRFDLCLAQLHAGRVDDQPGRDLGRRLDGDQTVGF